MISLGYPESEVVLEYRTDESAIDIAIPRLNVAIEVDGPTHYFRNRPVPLGRTLFKRRLLGLQGWRVVTLEYLQWRRSQTPAERLAGLEQLLVDAGVPTGDLWAAELRRGEAADEVRRRAQKAEEEAQAEEGEGVARDVIVERAARLALQRGGGKGVSKALVKVAMQRKIVEVDGADDEDGVG